MGFRGRPGTRFGIGMKVRGRRDWKSAAGFYKAALGLTSGNATVEFKLGKAYGNMGDYANAVDHLKTALQLNPQASFAAEAQSLLTQYQSKVTVTPGGSLVVRVG